MHDVQRGTIKGFSGSWSSGLGHLIVDDHRTGCTTLLPCDNPHTVRLLDELYGNVIGPGHAINPAGNHVGQEIFYECTDWGLLDWICPIAEAPLEMVELYEAGV